MKKENEKFFQVRDTRKKEQFVVDDAYLNGWARHCGIYATGVYVALCRHADFGTQACFPSMEKIAEKLGISRRQVQRAIKILEDLNIIIRRLRKKDNGGYLNEYVLIDKTQWKLPTGTIGLSETNSPNHWDSQSYTTGTDSPKKDSYLRIHNKDLSRERDFAEVQRLFPMEKIAHNLSALKIAYFLAQYREGKINLNGVKSANAYIRAIHVPKGWDEKSNEEMRKKEEAAAEKRLSAARVAALKKSGYEGVKNA